MKYILFFAILLLVACNNRVAPEEKKASPVERLDPALDAITSQDIELEVIGSGYEWSEGALWVAGQNMLLFSDVPKNTIYKWTKENGITLYLQPSGYTGIGQYSNEPGSNGLLLDEEENLILCQHGDRRIALMNAPIHDPKPDFITIADKYDNKKLNSPNDACRDAAGNIYFTDPPYGLPQQEKDATKETPYQGVYKITPEGKVYLLLDSLTRPNGIALSPDEKYLYVANSDPGKCHWYRYELGDSTVRSGGIFYDATALMASGPGVPDGMKVDQNGNIFGTGPGGICILNPAGKLLGRIRFDGPTSNCALADEDKTLYVTNDDKVVRVQLRK
ncbi:MAG: SMP-30/gluconolactonase/LRE family protein [Saprospiraceae bacterium]